MEAAAICGVLFGVLQQGAIQAHVHSAFENATNLATPHGLITLLSQNRLMQPYGVRLIGKNPSPTESKAWESYVRITHNGISTQNGTMLVSFAAAQPIALAIVQKAAAQHMYAQQVKTFLTGWEGEYCLSPLVMGDGGKQNVYTVFLAPRIAHMRNAIHKNDAYEAERAAGDCAGCGMGLTPSSDDFLVGYLAALYAQKRISRAALCKMAALAAQRTNDISASFLQRLGEGLVGEAILALLTAINAGEPIDSALRQAAQIGGTSGTDILTGVYFGLLDGFPDTAFGG